MKEFVTMYATAGDFRVFASPLDAVRHEESNMRRGLFDFVVRTEAAADPAVPPSEREWILTAPLPARDRARISAWLEDPARGNLVVFTRVVDAGPNGGDLALALIVKSVRVEVVR